MERSWKISSEWYVCMLSSITYLCYVSVHKNMTTLGSCIVLMLHCLSGVSLVLVLCIWIEHKSKVWVHRFLSGWDVCLALHGLYGWFENGQLSSLSVAQLVKCPAFNSDRICIQLLYYSSGCNHAPQHLLWPLYFAYPYMCTGILIIGRCMCKWYKSHIMNLINKLYIGDFWSDASESETTLSIQATPTFWQWESCELQVQYMYMCIIIINPRYACAGGLRNLSCVYVSVCLSVCLSDCVSVCYQVAATSFVLRLKHGYLIAFLI